MKSYTDLEQSKKLTEILSVESADMVYVHTVDLEGDEHYDIDFRNNQPLFEDDICAWSLAALLDLCPTINGKQPILTRGKLTSLWYCYYEDEIDTQTYDNPIDACYEMITRLNELNLL